VARKHKATKELEPVDIQLPVSAYLTAVKLATMSDNVDMPVAFDHPTMHRAAGSIRKMVALGADNAQCIPDYDITVQGRRGQIIHLKMLAHHCQIFHSFTEADQSVTKYKRARNIK
jgi:hypothetical protein